ncbi:unnamed protein product, partial [Scytosiphon promiscuus]
MTSHAVSTAVIGAGDWGKNHVRKFHELGSLKAIAETNPETIRKMKDEFGVETRPYEEIISDPAIDAIVLATPAITHKDLALKAIAKGKHLFIEKPIALTHKEALEITNAANQKGVILMVGHLLQYHPSFMMMKQLVQN